MDKGSHATRRKPHLHARQPGPVLADLAVGSPAAAGGRSLRHAHPCRGPDAEDSAAPRSEAAGRVGVTRGWLLPR